MTINSTGVKSSEFSISETCGYTGWSMIVFACVNFLFTRGLPKFFPHLATHANFWRFKNTCVSWLHSIISTLFVITNIIRTPEMFEDMINVSTKLSYITICVSTGYFIYDAIDIIKSNKKLSSQSIEVLAHHFVIIGIFWVPLVTNKFVGYTLAALSIEFNTVFLHFRFLILFNNVDKSSIKFRVVSILNLVTFVMFRILTLCWMTRWIVLNRHLVHIGWFTLGSIGLAAMMLINIFLLQRLLQSDFRHNHAKQLNNVKEINQTTNDTMKMSGHLHTD